MPAPGGGVDEAGTARQNSAFFEVDPETARLHMRPEYVPLALAYKERAAFTRDQLACGHAGRTVRASVPVHRLREHHGRLLLARPLDDEPDAQRLWDAIVRITRVNHKGPVATTPDDWPRIVNGWTAFRGYFQGRGSCKYGANKSIQ